MPFQSGDHPPSWRSRSGGGLDAALLRGPYRSADVRPPVNSTIRSIESMIWASSSRSRCIQNVRLVQNLVPQQAVQRLPRHEFDPPTEQVSELVLQPV
jgi:hypothetical protein